MDLSRIIINETVAEQVIVLKEREGSRNFPIVIGIAEAMAIDRAINDRRALRPMTHDLIDSILRHLKWEVERVVVNDLRDKTFYAKLVLVKNGERVEVDSRPSDAIALAVLRDTPVYVEERVLRQVCKEDDLT
jgi:bifunctional DNase/RNase